MLVMYLTFVFYIPWNSYMASQNMQQFIMNTNLFQYTYMCLLVPLLYK
jgi:hypothetical protein